MSFTTEESLLNILLFNERCALAVPGEIGEEDHIETDSESAAVATMAVRNLEALGYTLDKPGFQRLVNAPKEDIVDWYENVYRHIEISISADKVHIPFYPNFPDDHIDHEDIEKIIDQLMHYWTGYRPSEENKKEGIESLEKHQIKVIKTVEQQALRAKVDEIFENLLSSKINLPESQYDNFVIPYITITDDWVKSCKNIANRDTMCMLYAIAMIQGKDVSKFPDMVTNDVLRIAKQLAAKKYGLFNEATSDQKIESLPKKYYRILLKNLSTPTGVSDKYKAMNLEDDFARDREAWKIFLKHAHIHSDKAYSSNKYDALKLAHQNLCNNNLRTYYGRVERAFANNDLSEVIKIYNERPGEFIKNINRMIETADKNGLSNNFISEFAASLKKVLPKVRTEDLFSLYEYVNSRGRDDRVSVHNVKGHFYQSDKEYAPYHESLVKALNMYVIKEIQNQIRDASWNGKSVYIDPALIDMKIPGKDRSESSQSTSTYTKGSAIDIEKNENGEAKNTRMFIWWTNQPSGRYESAVDIDLSINLYDKNKCKLSSLNYSCTDGNRFGCHHSGDITNGGSFNGPGATEYIDMNIQKLKEKGIKYVEAFVNCYSGETFDNLNCQFGWMERDELDKTKQFDARAVKQKSELTSQSRGVTPVIFDVDAGKVIWVDTPNFDIRGAQNIHSISSFEYLSDKYCNNDRMSMYELANIATQANGAVIVDDIDKADIVFSVNNIKNAKEDQLVITSKDQDVWIKNFMTPHVDERKGEKEKEPSVTEMLAQELISYDNSTKFEDEHEHKGKTGNRFSEEER